MGATPEESERAPEPRRQSVWKRRVPRPLRHGITLFLLVLVVEVFVLPQLAGARKSVHLLGNVNIGYLVLGVGLEMAALLAYAGLTRAVLPAGAPRFFTLLRINMSSLAVSHVIPAGTAGGTGLGYRLLTEQGVRGADAAFGVATQGIGSALVLNLLLWLALLISIPLSGFGPLYGTAALVGVLLLAGFAALVLALTRGREKASRVLSTLARKVPFLDEASVTRTVERLAFRVRELGNDRKLLVRAGGWAAANWLLDAASLWVFVGAFGHFGLANVLAAVPVTPGGLGVVEGVLISTLVGFGTARGIALLGVVAYRLVNFWLPIPLGALAYLSLRVDSGASRQRRSRPLKDRATQLKQLRQLTDRAEEAKNDPGAASWMTRVRLGASESGLFRGGRPTLPG
jgi:uncharacterized protein (TIRG00374 family)